MLLWGGGAAAAPQTLWHYEFGAVKPGPLCAGADVVADSVTAGSQCLQLAFAKEGNLPAIATAKDVLLAGTGTLRVWVRGKDLNTMANGLRLKVALDRQGDRQGDPSGHFESSAAVYGIRAGENAYRVLPIPFEVADAPALYTLSLTPIWQAQTGDRKPTVWINRMELEAHGTNAPYITGLLRSQTMVAPGAQVQIAVTLINPTKAAFQGKLVAEDFVGIEGRRLAATVAVSLAPGERRVVDVAWKARGPEAGHDMQFALQDRQGQELDRDRIDVGITANGMTLHFPSRDFVSHKLSGTPYEVFYVQPESHTERANVIARAMRDRDNRCGRMECFGWSWGDLAGFIPPEDPFMRTWDSRWLSLKTYKERVAMMKPTGTHVQSYILGCAFEEAGYELYQQHPDWFIYDRNGEVGDYDLEAHARYSRRHEFEFDPLRKNKFGGVLDATHPEVRRWIADQIIRLGKEMGFQGVRWDVWWLNVAPGFFRIDGTEIAPTLKEADRLSAESLKAVKALVARELPDFSWGYNSVSPEEKKDYPLHLAEMCRDHAWMLDEVTISYDAKTSPYHYWDAYRKRIVDWGDHIRQLGGIYDPWLFDRGYFNPAKHGEADWLQACIFRVLSGGRFFSALYRNDSALAGDLPRLAFRFSDTYSGWNLRQQPENQTRIVVDAPATLWWKGTVFSNRSPEGNDQAIVHLVNSPVAEEIGENKESKVRPPVMAVKVHCHAMGRRLPRKAWLVAAESLTPDVEPRVQAASLPLTSEGDAVSVMVPAVIYLKTVVFEF
ncbi:MAG: hypothetical protein PHR35_02695 [Kiritimatiellae bacterium]|nr:hypothetical protein [Kiritimatiellia bacterium]